MCYNQKVFVDLKYSFQLSLNLYTNEYNEKLTGRFPKIRHPILPKQ